MFQIIAIEKKELLEQCRPMDKTVASTPFPLGAVKKATGWNFAVYSKHPVEELVYAPLNTPKKIKKAALTQTGFIWHVFIETNETELLYAYRVNGKLLIDPYAKLIKSGSTFGENAYSSKLYESTPIGVAFADDGFSWNGDSPPNRDIRDLIIYEMHVRAFNGTYKGLIEKIPYLKELGINAIELLPIFEFDEADCIQVNPKTKEKLLNFWGYQPLSFFAPMLRYAASDNPIDGLKECKEMVKACHKEGIEVILDIVFNHTGEGNQDGRTISWKGFSESDYYLKSESDGYLNYSGCGNTLNCNHPVVSDMLIDSLRYWVVEMHVDGFRFDLASILMRGQDGGVLEASPLLERITQDPILSKTKLIAEPWDAAGLHQVGHFFQSPWLGPEQWLEWNDDYRMSVRKFLKGTPGFAGKFATKICGSEDIYGQEGGPLNSINYIACHDGFTLRDLVSYQNKHNEENGEQNRDGGMYDDTWNCGVEGPTTNREILTLREKQMKNFCVALMVSIGVPMIHMGDEYGHTKRGNNNTWCQDNDLNWFNWHAIKQNKQLVTFWKMLIEFRKSHDCLRRKTFFAPGEIQWHGEQPNKPNWSPSSHLVAYTIDNLYIAFNAGPSKVAITLPEGSWKVEISSEAAHPVIDHNHLRMAPFSSIILSKAKPR